jgi:hypothetical protein
LRATCALILIDQVDEALAHIAKRTPSTQRMTYHERSRHRLGEIMTTDKNPSDQAPELPFRSLLYRFLFFDWLFRDVSAARTASSATPPSSTTAR